MMLRKRLQDIVVDNHRCKRSVELLAGCKVKRIENNK